MLARSTARLALAKLRTADPYQFQYSAAEKRVGTHVGSSDVHLRKLSTAVGEDLQGHRCGIEPFRNSRLNNCARLETQLFHRDRCRALDAPSFFASALVDIYALEAKC